MKKFLLILSLCLGAATAVHAQKLLTVEDTTEGIGVYPCGDRHEALVVFHCKEPFGLVFESNYDRDLTVEMDSVAGVKTYRIVFTTMAPGVDYSGRHLTIKAPGFQNYILPLNLRDKQKFEYTVSDPYSLLRSPFFLYQEKGNEKFYLGEYQGARDYYMMVKACPEYEDNAQYINEHIATCDSMVEWNALAAEYEHFGRYREAYEIYSKMIRVNSENSDLRERSYQCLQSFNRDCDTEFELAAHYTDQNDLEKARDCYLRTIDKDCYNKTEAARQLSNVQKQIRRKNSHARCLMYDFQLDGNLPIGLTYAVCHEDRLGGYFTVRMNISDFDLISKNSYIEGSFKPDFISTLEASRTSANVNPWRNVSTVIANNDFSDDDIFAPSPDDYEKDEKGNTVPKELDFEAAFAAGWVLHVWSPLYVHFTPIGYHGGGFYTFDKDEMVKAVSKLETNEINNLSTDWDEWSTELRYNSCKANWYNAWAPEVGIIAKYWRVCAKFTYQFNYWLGVDDEFKDFYDDNQHKFSVALGFCW